MQDPRTPSENEEPTPEELEKQSVTAPHVTRPSSLEQSRLHQDTSQFVAIPRSRFEVPRQVSQVDQHATQVSTVKSRRQVNKRKASQPKWRISIPQGCSSNIAVIGAFAAVILLLVGVVSAVIAYFTIAVTLPSVDDLRSRSAQFETTRILDRNGNTLYEILDPTAGRRTYVQLGQISPALVAATIATEDKDFYSHPGFDPVAILQAIWANVSSNGNGGGASTITQQLARALLLSPEERVQRSYLRKVREIILSAEITRQYSKDEILELYLNEIYYGNLSYGIEAAATTYFGPGIDGQANEFNPQGSAPNGRLADDLSIAQAAFLAGLPQSPAVYDIYTNRDLTLSRDRDVLNLLAKLSSERDCIYVSNWPSKVCLYMDQALQAANETESFNFPTPNIQMRYPHWVNYIRSQLESQYDAQTIYRSGFTVTTTLDAGLQDMAQKSVSDQIALLYDNNARNGALVAVQPSTGQILAMVGSADFENVEIDGQINMAISTTRQPGSSIKPFTYLAAFEKGWTPATLIWDVPSKFPPSGDPNDPSPAYEPVNYDGNFHGPVTVRAALANSYNIPAVKALDFVGIYDDPNTPAKEGLIGMAEKLGVDTLTRTDYGLSLTLGGGEVSLLEMTHAYAVLADEGKKLPLTSILKITDHTGNLIFEHKQTEPEQVISPQHAYLMYSILSDYEARQPMFGTNPVINLPFFNRVAAKTGTTNDYRDNWTMGYSPDIAVGVWVGNADYSEMIGTTGITGAGPIWANFMTQAIPYLTGGEPTAFRIPDNIIQKEICKISGTEPSDNCPERTTELFVADQPPLKAEDDLWKKVSLDTWTGLKANQFCKDSTKEEDTFNVTDTWAQKWIRKDDAGIEFAKSLGFEEPIFFTPTEECTESTSLPNLSFVNINDGDTFTSESVNVRVIANADQGFATWHIDLAEGTNPGKKDWQTLYTSENPIDAPTEVVSIQLSELPAGDYSIRLYMESKSGGYYQKVVHFLNNYVMPTSIIVPTATTPATQIPTETGVPTSIATEVSFPTFTPIPAVETPTETPTSAP